MAESSTVMPMHDETVKLSKSKGSSHMSTIQKRASIFTVILKPHNTSFQTRTLELKDKVKIRIGRQTSSKTAPTAFNGYFDSKVLSRQHAEIWCDKSRVYVKDVKSSNGTFINGERLSNEGEESDPRELNNQDEIEFGIDILNDHGAIMYHKVSCSVHIFPVSLSQVDDGIIKELSNHYHVQVYPDPHLLVRKSSASSINTLSSVGSNMTNGSSSTISAMPSGATAGGGGGGSIAAAASAKRLKKMESLLTKLQSEIEKSRHVENELKTIRDAVTGLDKVFSEDSLRKNDELQLRLNQAEATIKAFDSKWKHQNQAIQTAKSELQRLEKELSTSNFYKSERDKIKQELQDERQKVKELENRLEMLSRQQTRPSTTTTPTFTFLDAIQIKSIQILFAVFIGVISTLIWVLYK